MLLLSERHFPRADIDYIVSTNFERIIFFFVADGKSKAYRILITGSMLFQDLVDFPAEGPFRILVVCEPANDKSRKFFECS